MFRACPDCALVVLLKSFPFKKWLYQFTLSPEALSFKVLPTLTNSVFHLFHLSHSGGCLVVLYHNLNFYVSYD